MEKISIPISFFDTHYDGSKYPGSSKRMVFRRGANCQYFAYTLLKHFGLQIPDFRSSDLWEDTTCTKRVKVMKPLDILFFNKNQDSYGAHIGIYIGNDRVIHLSKEVGYPTVWNFEQFKKCSKYKFFIGAKRIKAFKR